jgi:hypothetical protein
LTAGFAGAGAWTAASVASEAAWGLVGSELDGRTPRSHTGMSTDAAATSVIAAARTTRLKLVLRSLPSPPDKYIRT